MKAIILAAGIASRLRPLTDNTPKCLLGISNKCLLQRAMDGLIENGIDDFVIVTGYLNQMIEQFVLKTYPNIKCEFIYNDVYSSTNNIYSLWLTKDAVKGHDVLLLDSDILFDPKIVSELLKNEHPNCLALNDHELGDEEIKIIADENNKIIEISKVCSIPDAIGESIGIEKMSKEFMDTLFIELKTMIVDNGQSGVFYELAFENIIKQGVEFYAVDTTQYFSMELDTVEDFEHACEKIPTELQ